MTTEPETGLPPEDAAFVRHHAAEFAGGDRHPGQSAAYADWYSRTYVPGAETLADLPDHPGAWLKFLAAEREAEAGS
jgi:hypothetical protein